MSHTNNNKLRIAMLGHKRIPSREGGVEVVVGELAARMVLKGHDVTCFNRKGHCRNSAGLDETASREYQGVKLKNVWTIDKRGFAALTSSVSASIRAALGKYDVVHFHAEGPCAMLWLPKLFGKRCIATIHGLDHRRAKWGKYASLYIRLGEKCAVRFADEIIVLSENVQNYFWETYGRKTVFIPNGVTRPNVIEANEIQKTYGIQKDEYILYLGRLVPEKGIRYLIEAYKQIRTDKKLVIAGGSADSGAYEQELKKLAADDQRIVFTGFVQEQVLEELYSNAYIYVLPSDLEGMPISLLEAMSYGNCCVTSDIPECSKVTGEFALTFRKGDANDLKNKLQELCDDPGAVERYKKQAADYICAKCDWNEIITRTLQLYGANE